VGALSAFMHDSTDIFDPIVREYTAIKLIAKIPTIAAISYRFYYNFLVFIFLK
jgi:citrate synthase